MLTAVPVVQWTRYGRWTPDGMHVLNPVGAVIYTHPAYRAPSTEASTAVRIIGLDYGSPPARVQRD